MKKKYSGRFYAWNEDGETAIAFSMNGRWFNEAINCCRDGDMGKKDEDGVYERHWFGDDIYGIGVENVRYATPSEVELYIKKCPGWVRENVYRDGISISPSYLNQTPEYTEAFFEL